jgi:hypothetical protein
MNDISYEQRRSGVTYKQELEILAEVYRLALEPSRERKQTAVERSPASDSHDAENVTYQKEVSMT